MVTTELITIDQSPPPTLFGTDNARAIIASASEKAAALADVIKQRKLYSIIEGKEYVRVEGWTLLGTLLGVFPSCVWTHRLEDGWEARVEARTLDNKLVGAAEAQCSRDEANWSQRQEYALRSMAQTRATAKALRLPLGFIMALAGYEPTPAEEMESDRGFGNKVPKAPEPGPTHEKAADEWPTDDELKMGGDVLCRFCNGPVWDNRAKKAAGTYKSNAPDYSCKAKQCGGVAWARSDGDLTWKAGYSPQS